MLDKNALAQLRQLKQEIVSTKVHATGTVRGTAGRYGFLRADEGPEIYLTAEEMLKVFPDDRIQVEVIEDAKGKQSGVVEKVLESPLQEFTGHYVVRDKAHFVEPDLPRMSRWLFVPPRARQGANHGDWVRARISRHPFPEGKPQAQVLEIIGNDAQAGIANAYAIARHQLPPTPSPVAEADLAQPDFSRREDLTQLPFVTIDTAQTEDMDDALYAERDGDGWTLWVAIADPDAWLIAGSPLEQAAAARGQTAYLPGHTLSMLPEGLANNRCSLKPGEERLALVARLAVGADGAVTDYQFLQARIQSRAKLTYDNVAAFLEHGQPLDLPAEAGPKTIETLAEVAAALLANRRSNHLVMADRPDYRFVFDADGSVAAIERGDKNRAQQLVEDCMIATNRAAADYLQHDNAVFVAHAGLRQERREPIATLLQTTDAALAEQDLATLDGYVTVARSCAEAASEVPLHAVLVRSLERSQLSATPQPHFGMGLPRYTTITSPIRRWGDLLGHRAIKAKLRGEVPPALPDETLAMLQQQIDRTRQASHLAEQWLKCEYLARDGKGPFAGTIAQVNSRGFTVRLDATGIDGFVELARGAEKFSFDPAALALSSPLRTFRLEQPVRVTVQSVDIKRRSIRFVLCVDQVAPGVQAAEGASTES